MVGFQKRVEHNIDPFGTNGTNEEGVGGGETEKKQ